MVAVVQLLAFFAEGVFRGAEGFVAEGLEELKVGLVEGFKMTGDGRDHDGLFGGGGFFHTLGWHNLVYYRPFG